MLTMALAGDVMLGRGVDEVLRYRRETLEPWGDVLPLLLEADLRLINLECTLTEHDRPWTRTAKVFHFRADPSAVGCLQAARIDACSLANNHTLDFEEQGLADTLRVLDAAGIAHAGAGRSLEAARQPALLGSRSPVALVAFTDNEPEFAAGPDRPGTNFLPVSLEPEVLGVIGEAIARARAGGRLVVFSNHWGPNMVQRPSALFQRFAHAVIDLGADVYFGHSAHVFQGVEVYRGKPILYDTGDFLDDYAIDEELRNDWSFLFRVSFEAGKLAGLELVPVRLSYARVALARGSEREAILDRMEALSGELGTRFIRRDGRLWLERPARSALLEGPSAGAP